MNTFSIKESIRFGWDTFKKRPWFFIGCLLFIEIAANFSFNIKDHKTEWLNPAFMGIALVMVGVLAVVHNFARMGQIQFLLKAHDAPHAVRFGDLWAPHPFWKFFLTSVAYGLIIIAGLLLLIVPGIIWSLKYMFAPYIVIERGVGVRESLRESARITHGHKWNLLWFGLTLVLFNILGLICFIVGILVTMTVSYFAIVHVFRTLSRATA